MDTYLYGIAYECPKRNRNKNCPLFEIDHLSFEEKIIWINKLNEDKIEAILNYHVLCTKDCLPER